MGERGSGRAGTQVQQSQAETAAMQRRASEKQKEKGLAGLNALSCWQSAQIILWHISDSSVRLSV